MKLSIIIPYHRGRHFLTDCLESVRIQGLSDYETILVFDNVKEDMSDLIDSYSDLNVVIVELRKQQDGMNEWSETDSLDFFSEFSGVARARNAGLKAATGEYIYFLDSDDFILEDTLQVLLTKAQEHDFDLIYGKMHSTWFRRKVYLASLEEKEEKNETEESEQNQESSEEGELFREDFEDEGNVAEAYYKLFASKKGMASVSVLGILFHRSFLQEYHLSFEEQFNFYLDPIFILKVLNCIKEVAFVPEAHYIKRKHNDPINYPALLQLKREDKFEEYVDLFQRAFEEVRDNAVLRNNLENKLISNYTKTFAPRLRRSDKEQWRADRFRSMRELMLRVDEDKIKSLKGYKRRVTKALINNNVRGATLAVTMHLGIKKLKKIRKNRRIFSYYLYDKVFFRMPIKENWVMCETFLGKNYSDSPKYVYEYLNKHNPGRYRFIWCINQRTKIPFHPVRVKRFGFRYCYYMARSKYFVFNGRQPLWYRKREGMVFLETWHGTPLKKLAFDQEEVMGATPLYKAQFYSQSRKWDYLVAANRFSSEIFRRAFLFDKEMLEFGYPRNDILHAPNRDILARELKKKLRIPETKRTILYAPTWRDDEYYGPGEYKFALKLDLKLLMEMLGENYVVLLRTHYFIADSIDVTGFESFVINLSKYDDISELYLVSDILITDYSSVFFDYANLKRPILFYTYDLDKYRDMLRGFYLDIECEVPGPLLFTSEEIANAILNIEAISHEYQEKYDVFYEKFCGLEDGHASENVVKRVFEIH